MKICPRTTLAVFRPTPGRAISDSMSDGSSPLCTSRSRLAVLLMCFAFILKKPVGRTASSNKRISASAKSFNEGNCANSTRVTKLTRASVHCAERIVAKSSCHGSPYSKKQRPSHGYKPSRTARIRFTAALDFIVSEVHVRAPSVNVHIMPQNRRIINYCKQETGMPGNDFPCIPYFDSIVCLNPNANACEDADFPLDAPLVSKSSYDDSRAFFNGFDISVGQHFGDGRVERYPCDVVAGGGGHGG